MADYKKNNRTGGSYARAFTKHTQGPKELFDAECNSCHARCQVPFRPNGKKPVYCANCFSKNEAPRFQTSSFHRDSQARPQRPAVPDETARHIQDMKREIASMNATLQNLVTAVDTFNRATALTLEIQKHFPATTPAKTAAAKKRPAKAAKAAPKKASKKEKE